MSHNHAHHRQVNPDSAKALTTSALLIFNFMIVEIIGGYLAGSLVLIADAVHMLTDFVAIMVSLFAIKIAGKSSNDKFPYGYHRGQVIAAFFNSLTLFATTIWIIVEAVQRIINPEIVKANILIIFAFIGVGINLYTMFLLKADSKDDINIKSALVHVVGDLLGYVSAIFSGIIIAYTGWMIVDPLLSILFALLIIKSACSIFKESASILMQGTPKDINKDQVIESLKTSIPEIIDLRSMRIWSLTSNNHVMTVHVKFSSNVDAAEIISKIKNIVHEKFNINDCTIEINDKITS